MINSQHRTWYGGIKISVITLVLTTLYAFIRYNVIREIPLSDFPLFIMNKSFALNSIILIGASFLLGPLAKAMPKLFSAHLPLRKPLGLIGFGVAAVHTIISLILLSPSYYAKFYTVDGTINGLGQSTLLFGVLAFAIFTIVAITSLPQMYERLGEQKWKSVQRYGYLGYIFVLFHVLLMGARGWMNPESFAYGFISISLLSALIISFVLIVRLLSMTWHNKNSN